MLLLEIPALVDRLIKYNIEENHQYNATFVLNHEQSHYFTPDFLHQCGNIILKDIVRLSGARVLIEDEN